MREVRRQRRNHLINCKIFHATLNHPDLTASLRHLRWWFDDLEKNTETVTLPDPSL